MKRALGSLLCLLALAYPVEARQVTARVALVKLQSHRAAGATQGISDVVQGNYVDESVRAVLDEWGVDYYPINAASVPAGKMEWYRTGVFAFGPDTVTVSGVIHERYLRQTASLDVPQYRPDSLFLAARRPSVPQWFMLDQGTADITSGLTNVAACSTGISAVLSGGVGIPHECEACQYARGSDGVFFPTFQNMAGKLDLVNQPSGGVYSLAATFTNRVYASLQDSLHMPVSVLDISLNIGYRTGPGASADTSWLWKLPRYNVPATTDNNGASATAAPLLLGFFYSSAGDNETNTTSRSDFAYENMLVGMAAFDSCLSGLMLGDKKVRGLDVVPKKYGLTLDGAFAHSNQWAYKSGTPLRDSAAAKASLDTLEAYGIPYVANVNVDSVAAYPNERAWFKGHARFAPQVWTGADGGVAGRASRYWLHDLFGRLRARSAYGPANGAAADTSAYALFVYALARNDSLFGNKSSHFLSPPFDDYVPASGASGDSILIAAQLAGAVGVRVRGQDTLRVSEQTTNIQSKRLGLSLLAHSGEYVTGGSRIVSAGDGGVAAPLDSGYLYHPFCSLAARSAEGFARNGSRGGNVISGQNGSGSGPFFQVLGASNHPNATGGVRYLDPNKHALSWGNASRTSIMKVHMAGLAGSTYVASLVQPSDASTANAYRPGWHAVRSMDGLMKAMNLVGGRRLAMWAYPEEIEP